MTQAPGALPTPTMLDYEQTLILAIELSNRSWVLAARDAKLEPDGKAGNGSGGTLQS